MADNTAGQTATQTSDQGTPARAFGKDVFDATSITATEFVSVTLGYLPRYVCWENVTDRVKVPLALAHLR